MTFDEIVTLAVDAGLGVVVDLEDTTCDELRGACAAMRAQDRAGRPGVDLPAVARVEMALDSYED